MLRTKAGIIGIVSFFLRSDEYALSQEACLQNSGNSFELYKMTDISKSIEIVKTRESESTIYLLLGQNNIFA